MRSIYDERTVTLAGYISETGKTVRDAAKHFGVSKYTVDTVHSICVGCVAIDSVSVGFVSIVLVPIEFVSCVVSD